MKRTLMIVLLAAAMASFASVAMACTGTPRIDRREHRQHARIVQGTRSGALTPAERARLNAGQRHVDRMEDHAKSDGVVTGRERARITAAQNRQSRAIWRKKHNLRTQ